MARLTLCFVLLAAALGHAIEPSATLDKSVSPSNFTVLTSPAENPGGQTQLVINKSPNDMTLAADSDGICYKIRAYIFKRDDDHAPEFVRSTTCGPRQPRAKDAVWPEARLVPAD